MRTKRQDEIDHRKLLRREEHLLLNHLLPLVSSCLESPFELEDLNRKGSFKVVVYSYIQPPVDEIKSELEELFGATVISHENTRASGCCEICYSEDPVEVFDVSGITRNWPTEELAKLAPKPRKTT